MVGVYGSDSAAKLAYLCLYALQHRGQEGSGIASMDSTRTIHTHKGIGLVSDIYNEAALNGLNGNIAIGNNKYSTAKDRHVRNLLPLVADIYLGELGICMSGTFDSAGIRKALVRNGAIFTTSSDSEVLLHLIARRSAELSLEDAIMYACRSMAGAYSILFMGQGKLIAVRDPNGIKPLVIGIVDDAYVVVSETAALDLLNADFIREVMPGEVVIISDSGLESYGFINHEECPYTPCSFEYVYVARPDSVVFGQSVYDVRKECGRQLARECNVEADIVIPVPDSGIAAALGYSHESGVPFELGIVRNHYVGRTFIRPDQEIRDFGVRVKLNPVAEIIKGKRLVVIDDSIVRGSTCVQIVKMLRHAGAKEVHMRIASPAVKFPCLYGIDTPDRDDLIANQMSLDEIRDLIGADSLMFLSNKGFEDSVGSNNYCYSCFSGNYLLKYN